LQVLELVVHRLGEGGELVVPQDRECW
jgi:hypothetical protein